jgi:hypothetical protein
VSYGVVTLVLPPPPLPREGVVLDSSLLLVTACRAPYNTKKDSKHDSSKQVCFFCKLQQLESKPRVTQGLDFSFQGAASLLPP